jgi:hypothetical protein
MLGQLLITLIVIALAVVYIRRRQKAQQKPAPENRAVEKFIADARATNNPWQQKTNSSTPTPHAPTGMAGSLKMLLWSVMALLLIIGSAVSYLHWQDQQRMVTVLLYRDAVAAPVIYRVAKRDLGERTFTTSDGTRVTVSANERIEIIGL